MGFFVLLGVEAFFVGFVVGSGGFWIRYVGFWFGWIWEF